MKTVGAFDAKTHLSELIDSGEVVTMVAIRR
jgi:antitoxin (DNA-binding transcriptional repressor) of toxin-antitoxin stability system